MQRVVAGVAPSRIPPRVHTSVHRAALRRPRVRPVCRVTFSDTLSDSTDFLEGEENFSQEDFVRAFDRALDESNFKFSVGQVVEGLVFDVDGTGAYVDFGSKEMGFCSADCLGIKKVPKPPSVMKPNTRHQFEIRMTGVKSKRLGGSITLLHRGSLLRKTAFMRLNQMSEFQIKFKVKVLSKNGGGYVVEDEMGMEGFLPGRQALINPSFASANTDMIVGSTIEVKVLDIVEERNRVVVTQRGVMGAGFDSSKFAIGNVLEGVVERVMPYGVFINYGSVSGLLHESNITSGHIQSVASVFSAQDKIKAMVIQYDRFRGRLSLSTRKLEAEPGDMLKDPQKVYDGAEEIAAQFREKLKVAEKRAMISEGSLIQPDDHLGSTRLGP